MDRIVTFTINPSVDKSSQVAHIVPEKKLRCDPPKFEPGGGGINVSRAIKKLGGESVAIYTCGGHTGHLFKSLLDKEGVNNQHLDINGWTRENFIVVDTSNEQQYRFGMRGPTITENEWKSFLDYIEKLSPAPEYLVASGSLNPGVPFDFYAQMARVANKIGARYVLDTSGEPLKVALQEGIFLLKPNLGELGKLAGVESVQGDMVIEIAREIINEGKCEVIVVSLGPGGAMLVTKDIAEHIPTPTVKKKSTVGAGDSMVAGLVISLANGKSYQEMVRFGVACGTAATMNPGTELCKKEDAEHLYQWISSRAPIHT